MTLKRRQFTREFKLQVLQEAVSGKSISQLARERQVHPTLIHRWQYQLRRQGDRTIPGHGKEVSDEAQIAALEHKVGQLTMDYDLQKILESAQGDPALSPRKWQYLKPWTGRNNRPEVV